MSLAPGSHLGPYEVLSVLGAGGMGEVYRARDTKLGREVAVKLLPAAFTNDPERLARFRREAQLLASLNHPHIGAIYGLDEADSLQFLVLELVDGESLDKRISRGAIPVDEALAIAKQIAEAVEAAHDKGIIHRDLKPANIVVTHDGTVKVLDFGLAKATQSAGVSSIEVTHSPTITTPAMLTGVGMILGTAAYMSPEQAKGRPADKRSDVWAFGCVLYEMFTGTRAFEGEDVADTLAAVLRGEPDWSALPAATPEPVRALLIGCLNKDRRTRIGDMSTALFVLGASWSVGRDRPTATRASERVPLYVALASILAIIAALVVWSATRTRTPSVASISRLELTLAPSDAFTGQGRHLVAISPDGRRLAYTANNQLYIRSLDRLEPVAVSGSGGPSFAREPFFSPDGRWLGFWHDGSLKKVSVSGGVPVVLCQALNPWGVNWVDDDIVYGEGPDGIWRVPAAGGLPTQIISVGPGELAHGPQLMPGGHAVLFTLLRQGNSNWDQGEIVVQTIGQAKPTTIVTGGSDGRYLQSGHLIYGSEQTLFVVPFDLKTLTVTGGPVARVDGVARAVGGQTAAFHYAVAGNGTLTYIKGTFNSVPRSSLVWVSRVGREEPTDAEPRAYLYPHISPDGTRVALSVRDQTEGIWIWDLSRKTLSRVTTLQGRENFPIWTPDAKRIVFSANRGGNSDLWWQAADGSGTAAPLTQTAEAELPTSVAPDGSTLVFQDPNAGDLHTLSLDATHKIASLLKTRFQLRNAEVSPDGHWLAYESLETGQPQIYVQSFPDVNLAKFPISTSGGTQPLWSRDGRELFYVRPAGGLMRVAIDRSLGWKPDASTQLFDGPYAWAIVSNTGRLYDIAPDGNRFLMLKPLPTSNQPHVPSGIVVVQNWFSELESK